MTLPTVPQEQTIAEIKLETNQYIMNLKLCTQEQTGFFVRLWTSVICKAYNSIVIFYN